MKKRVLGILGAIIVCCAGLMAQPVGATSPVPEVAPSPGGDGTCGGSFLGFKPWHEGLCSGGEIREVENEEDLKTFVWTIVLNVIFDLSLAIGYIAVAMVIYAGYMYIMSQGDPGRMAKAKKSLATAITGTIIAMGATVIVNTLKLVLGINGNSWNQGGVSQDQVQGVFTWAYSVAGLVAVIFIIKGGVDYMLSTGDPGKIRKATQSIIVAVVGLIVVILAAVITGFVTSTIGGAM